jgi:hypothetical protein
VTHPFHPLFGREFELLTYKQAWGEDRVYFRDDKGRLRRMPVGWTSVEAPDPFRTVAAGRCRFRTGDLLKLADLLSKLTSDEFAERKGNDAAPVKINTPRKASNQPPPRGHNRRKMRRTRNLGTRRA